MVKTFAVHVYITSLRRMLHQTSDSIHFYYSQKDIAFVIPPSKPPSTTLYGPATLRGYGDDRNTSSREEKPAPKEEGVVNRGWNFLGEFKSIDGRLPVLNLWGKRFKLHN